MTSAVQQRLFGPTPEASKSQWFTPDWLATRTVEWGLHDFYGTARVIELGAGDGAFVKPLLVAGCHVIAVERDPRYAEVLRTMRDKLSPYTKTWEPLTVLEMDALAPELLDLDGIDASVGNPPYEDDNDLAFVERGLALAPRVVAVLRLVFLAGKKRRERIWNKHHLARMACLSERPGFIGEKDESARTDFAVFDIRRGPAPKGFAGVQMEHW